MNLTQRRGENFMNLSVVGVKLDDFNTVAEANSKGFNN
jgi:hypothetical protein